jgi:hypothetical protein
MITEDPAVFFDLDGFAVEVTLSMADDSGAVVTQGISEDGATEDSGTGRSSNPSFFPQITVPTAFAKTFGEGDQARFIPSGETTATTFIILDSLPDGLQTTLTLEE